MQDIDKNIAELNSEIENLNQLWLKEITEASKNRKYNLEPEKLNAAYKEITDKHMPTIVEKEDQLEELLETKNRGV